MRLRQWDEELWLFYENDLDQIPDGIQLKTINGDVVVKSPKLDQDTRYGLLAYGLTYDLAEGQGLKDKFLLWTLVD
jgi:hypothetical protein